MTLRPPARRSPRRGAALALGVLLSLVLLGADTQSPPAPGDAAPAIVLRDLDGAWFRLSTVVGSKASEPAPAVVVNFFATWCEPCIQEMPALQEVARRHRDRGVRLVLVNVREDAGVVQAWRADAPADATVLHDLYGVTAKRYGADRTLPWTFVIGPDGRVAHRIQGKSEELEQELDRAIAQLLP